MTEQKRYYYDDPLAAAWMAKHFGMKFQVFPTPEQIAEYESDQPWDWEETYCFPDVEMIRDCLKAIENASNIICVHPASLHLLKPQEHDLVMFSWSALMYQTLAWVHEIRNGECIVACGPEGPDNIAVPISEITIIQRNGLAFMWPKEEA